MSERARNVVLVHGAFADGSSWADVIAELQRNGYKAVAVQNPLTSLADDVMVTKRAIALQEGPTILVGHSYGGVVITEAGDDPKVVGLVYIAALAPEVDEAYADLAAKFPEAPGGKSIKATDGFAKLDEEGFINNFAQDIDEAKARVLGALQGPIAATLFGDKTSAAAWKSKPSWYAVSTQDRMVSPELQRHVAKRMNATTVEIDTSHASPVTRPVEIAKLIMEAGA